MEFRVREGALERGAEQMTTLSSEVTAAEVYATSYVDLNGLGSSGIFVTAIGALDSVREAIGTELAHLRELTSASGGELAASARHYRTTDDATDARMDRTYSAGTPSALPPGLR